MGVIDPDAVARGLYQIYVTDAGFSPPETYADLLLFVELSQCPVIQGQNPPDGFTGIEIGGECYVNGSDILSDRERVIILAHEWAHSLRRRDGVIGTAYMYGGHSGVRGFEEEVACAFERLF